MFLSSAGSVGEESLIMGRSDVICEAGSVRPIGSDSIIAFSLEPFTQRAIWGGRFVFTSFVCPGDVFVLILR